MSNIESVLLEKKVEDFPTPENGKLGETHNPQSTDKVSGCVGETWQSSKLAREIIQDIPEAILKCDEKKVLKAHEQTEGSVTTDATKTPECSSEIKPIHKAFACQLLRKFWFRYAHAFMPQARKTTYQ